MRGSLVLFPGALGDFICFLPTLAGLRERYAEPLTLVVKPELHSLLSLRDATLVSIDRREIADLYGEGEPVHAETRELLGGSARAYSWTGANVPSFESRLGAITTGPTHVFPFRALQPGEHAVDYYARCAGVAAVPFTSMLSVDTNWFAEFERRSALDCRTVLVVHPGSGSPAKNWTGFDALAQRCQQHFGGVVILQGPAELESSRAATPPGLVLANLSLPQVAALLQGAGAYVGNDSGVSHLAGAVDAKGVVLFGPTDPSAWAPRGKRLQVLRAPEACETCGASIFCTHRLSVDRVGKMLLSLT